MKNQKKPSNLPNLKPETVSAINELLGGYGVNQVGPPLESHGRFLIVDADVLTLYHGSNVYVNLLWFMRGIRQYEKRVRNGEYDPSMVHDRPEEMSVREFEDMIQSAEESYHSSLNVLARLQRLAADAEDSAFPRHLEFASRFAEDDNRCRRLALADITRNPCDRDKIWSLDELRELLRGWHQLEVPDNRRLKSDCEALGIRLVPGEKTGRPKKSPNKN